MTGSSLDRASSPFRIALVVPHLGSSWPGGQVMDLAVGLRAAGARTAVLAEDGRLAHDLARRGVPVVQAPLPRHGFIHRRRARSVRESLEAALGGDPDVIHAHGAAAATPSAVLAEHSGAELLLTLYDRVDARATPPVGRVKVGTVFVHTLASQEELVNHRGVPRELVRLVSPGLDHGRIAAPLQLPPSASSDELEAVAPARGDSVPVVGVVGDLEPLGGHDTLFEAVAALRAEAPGFRLLVAGEGAERRRLLGLSGKLGLHESIVFAGDLPGRDELFASFSIFVAPGQRDGFGHDLIEAMARGLPVVATGAGAVFDYVVDGETGLLVPPDDAPALTRALGRLLREPLFARSLGERARDETRGRFPIGRLVDEVIDACERAVASRGEA